VNSGDFRFISGYVCSLLIAISVVNGLAALKPPHELSVVLPVAGISISCRYFTSGLNFISGSTFIPRPPRARDWVTMTEAGNVPGRFTAGVGSASRGAETEPNSPDRSVRPTLRFGSESIFTTGNFTKLLTDLGKIEQTAEARM